MSKTFVGLLNNYVEFSPDDLQAASKWEAQIRGDNRTIKTLASGKGGGMGSIPLQVGNVDIGYADGIKLKNPGSGDIVFQVDAQGDMFLGSNIGDVEDTTLVAVSNIQNYNGEALGAGDLLLGDNSSGKANLFWDRSAGTLSLRSGTTDSVVLGATGISATYGEIGGWLIDSTRIYGPAEPFTTLELDSANSRITVGINNQIIIDGDDELITLGSGTPKIYIDGGNLNIKSSTYSAGTSGFFINEEYAEFGDVKIRGSLKASTFEYGEVHSIGGTLYLSQDSGIIAAPGFVTPAVSGTVQLSVRTHSDGTQWGAAGDKVRVATWDGSNYISAWLTLTTYLGIGADPETGDSVASYTATMESGDVGKTIPHGTGIVNVGPSGAGIIDLQAGSQSTRIKITEHAGSPWTTQETKVVLGNLRGEYGTGANDRYGLGIGDYTGGNYVSYNAEVSDSFVIKSGDGKVQLNESGIAIWDGGADKQSFVTWWYDDSGTNRLLSWIYGDYGGAGDAVLWLRSDRSASSPWSSNLIYVKATDSVSGDESSLRLYGDGKVYLVGDGDTVTISSYSGAASSNIYIAPAGTITLESDNVVHLSNKGLYVGSSGAGTVADGEIYTTGTIRSMGATTPPSGTGLEMYYSVPSGLGRVFAYDRTGSAYKPLELRGSWIKLQEGSTTVVTVDNGDFFTTAWTDYSGTSTITGWTSFTTKKLSYKTIGKMVFVNVFLEGTSNSTSTSFTLPYTNGMGTYMTVTAQIRDNSTFAVGLCQQANGAGTVICYPAISGGTWTASGIKSVRCQFWYNR